MQKVVETEGEGEQDGSVIRNANGRLRAMEHCWGGGWGGDEKEEKPGLHGKQARGGPPPSASAPQEV